MMMMIMMVMIMINEIKQLPEFAFLKLVVADRNISKVLFSMCPFFKRQRLKGPKCPKDEVKRLEGPSARRRGLEGP